LSRGSEGYGYAEIQVSNNAAKIRYAEREWKILGADGETLVVLAINGTGKTWVK
jgi:hypothetical protein